MAQADPFLDQLNTTVAADPAVIGLVLCGSSAEPERRDEWSDHDFLMITVDGRQEAYRTDLSWLPHPDQIVWSFRETAHGLKVLYRSGLLLEFAVFDRAEFATCALNHAAVVLDRGGIAEIADVVRGKSLAPRATDRLVEFRMFLALIYIGTGRARRGERLSANAFIRTYAVEHLLRLVRDLLPVERTSSLDVLDPWRRFESADPAFAAAVDRALSTDVLDTGRALMSVAGTWLARTWPDYPADDATAVRDLLGW